MKTYAPDPTEDMERSIALAEELAAMAPGKVLTLPNGYYFTKLYGSTWLRNGTRRGVNSHAVAAILKSKGGRVE